MKIVLYGLGKRLKEHYQELQNYEVVAIADQKADEMKSIDETIPFILPEEIKKISYDYIVVSSLVNFESIKQQLICENHITKDKIISMQLLISSKDNLSFDDINMIKRKLGRKCIVANRVLTESKKNQLLEQGYSERISCASYDIYAERRKELKIIKDISIYIITHREYDFENHPGYITIGVGNYCQDGILLDKGQDSIAYLNNRINEMTALYWVWKNQNIRFVGFCHYRRFFYDNEICAFENWLRCEKAKEYLERADLIVSQRTFLDDKIVSEEIKQPLSKRAYENGYQILVSNISKYQPDYLQDFDKILNGQTCCYYNMFVTRWELFDEYCSWLFSFLIPAAEEFDVDKYEGQDKRTIGFFAERMLSVWLHHNPRKIKSLPVYTP